MIYGERSLQAWFALALTAVAVGCGGDATDATDATDAADTAEAAPLVLAASDVATVRESAAGGGIEISGNLNPYRSAEVRAQVSGTVSALTADAGDRVAAGETLARIEAAGIRSQAAGARAGVAAAESCLALARRQLESARTLYEAGAMSEIDYQQAQAAYEAAQSQLAAARAQASTTGEAASRTVVRAPFAGEVAGRMVELGEAVNPAQPLFRVVDRQILELQGQVGVRQAADISVGQPVEFSVSGYESRVFRGEVARVEPTADPATRQVGVYVRLPNPGGRLVGGQYATGRILVAVAQESLVVPASAVRGTESEPFVWVVSGGTIERREVTVGTPAPSTGAVEVFSGLTAGERVVVAPGRLEEGLRVRLSSTEEG